MKPKYSKIFGIVSVFYFDAKITHFFIFQIICRQKSLMNWGTSPLVRQYGKNTTLIQGTGSNIIGAFWHL